MKELLRIGRKCKNEVPDSVKKYKVLDTVHSKRPTTLGWWNSARWKNNRENFMCIKCKENIAHTRTSARYNWSKNIRELILIKIYTEKNIHSITINLIVSITSVEICCQRDTNVPIMYVIGPQEMMKEMKRTAMNKELDLEVRNGRTGWIQLLRTVPWRKEKFKLMIRSELLKRNQWFSNGHYTIWIIF